MAERFDNRVSGWRGRGREIPMGHVNQDNWQQDYIIPLCSISAKTRLSPPITYWEASQDTDVLRGSIDSRQNSVWRNIKFTLNLRTTRVNHCRFLNLYCEPLPPLGYPPDRMSLSLSLEPGREEVMLIRYGKTPAGNFVDLRLFSYGSCRQYTKNSPGSSSRWTAILNNLRDALHRADGIMDLKLMLEKEDDMEMLRSFLAAAASYRLDEAIDTSRAGVPTEPRAARLRRESRAQFPGSMRQRPVVIEHRSPRPQTNPSLDPRVYDPFPGIPVPLVKGDQLACTNDGLGLTNDTKVSSESPAGASHMLAAMALSDGGVGREGEANGEAGLESHEGTVSVESSSEEWSFLNKKPGDPGQATSSQSSSSSSSSHLPEAIPIVSRSWGRGPIVVQSSPSSRSSPPPVPTPAPSPPTRRRRGPVVVKSESESSDVAVVSSRKLTKIRSKKKKGRKSAQLNSGGEEKMQKEMKKKRKKRMEVPEPTDEEEAPAHNVGDDEDEEMGGEVEEEELVNSDIERRRRKKERKRARKAKEPTNDKDVDNDGDIDMQNYENGSSQRLKKKKPKAAESELGSVSPAAELLPKKSKKHRKGKRKEKPPPSESEELPPLPPLSTKSSSKRKRHYYSVPEVGENDSMGEESSGDVSAWKKRLLEINLVKNELSVEEQELRAKIMRKQLTTRKQKAEDGHRFANCTCSACGEYGHRKDSWVCEKHPGRIGR